MGYQALFNESVTFLGQTYAPPVTIVETDFYDPAVRSGDNPLPAAKSGSLSLRTDDNTGELTMAGGHGVTTGARIDVYWTVGGVDGSRYGMTVGTVAGDVVPVDGGTGDNLPVVASDVTAMVPEVVTFPLVGNDADAIIVKASDKSTIVFREAAADSLAVEILVAGGVYTWRTGAGTNPVAGDTIVSILMSHKSLTTSTAEVIVMRD